MMREAKKDEVALEKRTEARIAKMTAEKKADATMVRQQAVQDKRKDDAEIKNGKKKGEMQKKVKANLEKVRKKDALKDASVRTKVAKKVEEKKEEQAAAGKIKGRSFALRITCFLLHSASFLTISICDSRKTKGGDGRKAKGAGKDGEGENEESSKDCKGKGESNGG